MEKVGEVWKNSSYDIDDTESGTSRTHYSPDGSARMGTMEEETSVICILSVFSVFGTLGNGLVLYVFTKKAGKLTSTIFILALAGTDIISCLVVIPFTITGIIVAFELRFDFFCKLYQFLITCIVPLSAFIMVAIAVDRYICICHPFVHIMTVKRAKLIVSILAGFAIVLGLITSLGFSVYQVISRDELNYLISNVWKNNSSYNLLQNNTNVGMSVNSDISANNTQLEKIIKYTGKCDTSTTILSADFMNIYQKVYSSFYFISLLVVLILYGMIYRSVSKQRAKRRRQKLTGKIKINTQSQTEEPSVPLNNANLNTLSTNNLSVKVETDGETVTTSLTSKQNTDSNGKTSLAKKHRTSTKSSSKEKKESDRLANIKTAMMLFIVTVVFIIAFLPAWLMAYRWLDFKIVVFYMYFVYNVANPVIYAFMNQMFREDLVRMFSSFQGCFHL
ncbi:hypothetical protein CHS0354_024795 [Potamilus streckersoni]|uniref:G-protein coupled receptors family 1 profile domain-containing protein n=1 Tax=Potamilus streckersoni TaxID=2493646 RepID=A0AAE0SZR7_9BIVA|nr:hypothetical protein CHS0354_024795 [Potamilus streckersoni]